MKETEMLSHRADAPLPARIAREPETNGAVSRRSPSWRVLACFCVSGDGDAA